MRAGKRALRRRISQVRLRLGSDKKVKFFDFLFALLSPCTNFVPRNKLAHTYNIL